MYVCIYADPLRGQKACEVVLPYPSPRSPKSTWTEGGGVEDPHLPL